METAKQVIRISIKSQVATPIGLQTPPAHNVSLMIAMKEVLHHPSAHVAIPVRMGYQHISTANIPVTLLVIVVNVKHLLIVDGAGVMQVQLL